MKKFVILSVVALAFASVAVTAALASPSHRAANKDICVLLPDPKSSVRWETQDRPALVDGVQGGQALVRDHERRR